MSRALTASASLRNDVMVLLEDGEEERFLGGVAFAAGHPWMADVKVVVGLDTGAWGPPHVIQTSEDNGLVVRSYADGVDDPLAYGFLSATDADSEYETEPFRSRGIPAIEIEDAYSNVIQHTSRDTSENVDPARVQQLGDQALGLARALGDEDLTDNKAPDRVFHTFPAWESCTTRSAGTLDSSRALLSASPPLSGSVFAVAGCALGASCSVLEPASGWWSPRPSSARGPLPSTRRCTPTLTPT
jgi:hypothetical protein